MAFVIPLTNDPARRIEIELNRIRLFLTTKYNYAGAMWFFDMEDSSGFLFFQVPLVIGVDLLEAAPQTRARIGQLWLSDITGNRLDPTIETLGENVIMLHYAPGEAVDTENLLNGII